MQGEATVLFRVVSLSAVAEGSAVARLHPLKAVSITGTIDFALIVGGALGQDYSYTWRGYPEGDVWRVAEG